ncbi:MAG: putative Ig domain-containing protein, partial [Bryobacteraceae bacterium]|nr:putative Ig domain-containing protein [Bryobacteraceae bacterium]
MLRTTLIIASLTLIQGAAGQISSGGGGVRQEGQAVQAAGHHAIQVLSRQVTRAQAPGRNCTEAIPENKFLTTDKEVYLRFTYSGGAAGDLAAVEWVNPKKSVYLAQPFNNSGSGATCHAWFIGIAGSAAASQPGQWSVRLRWNDAILFEDSFEIGNPGASSLNIVSNGVLPSGTTGAEYDYSFTTAGGKEPVVWSLESGSLPAGLRIASSGRISGTPTSPGSSRFTLKASDATGSNVTRTFAMGVSTADVIITPRSLLFSRAANGDRPAPQMITINSTGAQIDYTVVVEGAPWLTATPGAGTTSGTVAVSVDATGRDQGSYAGTIRVRSASANVNATIPVRLIVEDLDKPTVTRALISTVVGNDWIFPPEGVSRKAPFSKTVYMAADGAGNLYAADALSHVIVKMMPDGTF